MAKLSNKLINHIFTWEGGFIKSSSEGGGYANMGVTYSTYSKLCLKVLGKYPSFTHYQTLTKAEAIKFIEYFYKKSGGPYYKSQDIADMIGDWYWGSPNDCIKRVRRILNSQYAAKLNLAYTIVTKEMIEEVNKANQDQLYYTIVTDRLDFYDDLVSIKSHLTKYLAGWQNRTKSLYNAKINPQKSANGKPLIFLALFTIAAFAFKKLLTKKDKKNGV